MSRYRHVADLEQENSSTQISTGKPVTSPTTVLSNVPIAVEGASGGETQQGKQVAANVTSVVKLQAVYGGVAPTPGMWFTGGSLGSRKLNIMSVLDRSGRGREIECHCSEEVAG